MIVSDTNKHNKCMKWISKTFLHKFLDEAYYGLEDLPEPEIRHQLIELPFPPQGFSLVFSSVYCQCSNAYIYLQKHSFGLDHYRNTSKYR